MEFFISTVKPCLPLHCLQACKQLRKDLEFGNIKCSRTVWKYQTEKQDDLERGTKSK